MSEEIFAARQQMMEIAAHLADSDTEQMMDYVVAAWQRYKAGL